MSEQGSDAELSEKAREEIDRQAAESVEAGRQEDQAAADAPVDPDPEQEQHPDPIEEDNGS